MADKIVVTSEVEPVFVNLLKQMEELSGMDRVQCMNSIFTLADRAMLASMKGKGIATIDEVDNSYSEIIIPMFERIRDKATAKQRT
ncbi:hypothetical protein FJY93_05030 [Candidatus Kaiserbacteria bacterium]|nr:hypothetical protein [Candidatus Kaiserbacteria bacterium]